jgi:hypothetical protein
MAIADGFHVDNIGNHWIGSNRETFDATTRSEAPFYVSADGNLVAKSGTFSGNLSAAGGDFSGDISGASGTFTGNLSGSSISGGSININNNFIVDSSGNLTANNATLSGYLTSSSDISGDRISGGTIQGTTINAGNLTVSGQFQFGDVNISSNDIVGTIDTGAIPDTKLGNISANKITAGEMSADRISGGTIDAGYFTGSAGFSTLTASNLGIQGAIVATSSLTAGSFVNSGSYIRGTEFRGSNLTVYIKRSSTSNGMQISGSGSGAYVRGYNSSGGLEVIYSPYSGVSDERLKENVVDLSLGLDEINALRPVTFDWKASDIEDVPTERYGFIAQEVESVVPTMISTQPATRIDFDEEGEEITVPNVITLDDGTEISEWKSIDEKPLLYMLVKAVQELSAKNDELESRLAALEG